jgi:hypothetical protein
MPLSVVAWKMSSSAKLNVMLAVSKWMGCSRNYTRHKTIFRLHAPPPMPLATTPCGDVGGIHVDEMLRSRTRLRHTW